jgi:hypothetical protein
MKYLILCPSDKRIIHISTTLNFNSVGGLILDNGLQIVPNICEVEVVGAVPEYVEVEKYCYVNNEYVINENYVEPTEIVEEEIEDLTDIFTDVELKRAIELYDSVGMNTDYMLEDYNNDLLSINVGSDDQKYIWYLDDNYDIAINIESGEIVDAEQTEKLFA